MITRQGIHNEILLINSNNFEMNTFTWPQTLLRNLHKKRKILTFNGISEQKKTPVNLILNLILNIIIVTYNKYILLSVVNIINLIRQRVSLPKK